MKICLFIFILVFLREMKLEDFVQVNNKINSGYEYTKMHRWFVDEHTNAVLFAIKYQAKLMKQALRTRTLIIVIMANCSRCQRIIVKDCF